MLIQITKIQIMTAVLTGILALTPASPVLASDNVATSAPAAASVIRLNSRDVMIEGVSETARVQLHFAGAERLDPGGPGELLVIVHGSRQHYRPEAYQIINGKMRSVALRYKLDGGDRVTLNFGDFDSSAPIYLRGGASTM
jgi:hypothetical protein